jgi:DNA-binding transcriptional regulator YiaG
MEPNELRIGNYDVLEDGTVLNSKTGRILAHALNQKGYPGVSLHINGKEKYFRVHRLVALKFIPNPENKPCVNHIDRNRLNCHVSNLEWVTHKENVQHSVRNGGRKDYTRNNKGKDNPNSRFTDEHIEAIRVLSLSGFSQEKIARIFSVTQSHISKIQNNKLWKLAS